MMKHRIRNIAILVAILAIFLAACGPQETETPEPTDVPTEEVVETEEADAQVVETEEATEEPMEATEEAMDDMEATEEAMDDMEATEEAMDDMEATEEPMDDMEATEEAMDDMEATEEAMDDMEATEEPMDDMEVAVASFDDEAGFTFDYPDSYEINPSDNAITLDMGDQRLIVIPPASYNTVVGGSELEGEDQLTFFVERLGYTANGTAEMMMTAASINVELPRRGLVGFANLIDLGDDNLAVVLELGPDAENVPSADGGVISSSMVFFVLQAEEISVGDTVAASIEAGDRASYELTLADGETVNIFLNGVDGLDTYLRVYDADGALIAENDDLNGVSSGLEGFSVDGGGVVTLEVGTFADGEAGDYELVIEEAMMEEPMEEATEEAMGDMEATEEPMGDMEATEEPMGDMEATEEPMDDMEATEEPMDDMGDMMDGEVVSFDDEAGFTFDYPEGYEANPSDNAITLDMGDQRIIVIPPASYNNVVGGSELEGEEQLIFFVERLGYTANGTAEMMMTAASINVELPRRGLVGFANLIDLGDDNLAVVLELGPDAENVPSADGGVISSSMVFFVPQAEEISVGDTVTASIEAGDRASYELTLADGETVNIFLNGVDGLDTYLRVYDADGALIAENDDLNGVSSGLEGFSVDGGGVVTLEVGTFGDSEAGDYELVVEAAAMEEADGEEAMDDMAEPTLTIVGLALQTENLDTLATAIVRGGFLSTLNGEGPFTVFAPTDDAFATALDALGMTAGELLADQDLLSSVLTYHVIEGAVMSGDLEDGMEVETLNGAILTIGVSDDGVTVTDSTGATYNVIAADVAASNGVVHVIDGVLLPPSE